MSRNPWAVSGLGTLAAFSKSIFSRHNGHLGTAFGQFPFFGLLGRCIRRGTPVFNIARGACCIWARSLDRSRSQMLSACRPSRTQELLVLLLTVLLGSFSLVGCAGLTSANNPASNPKGDGSSTAPSITAQPVSANVIVGQTASFFVAVTGTAPFSYQCLKNGTAVSGATSSEYTTPPTTDADNRALFVVVVSNSAGSATSNAATLNVADAAVVAVQVNPTSATVALGSTQQFAPTVTGSSNTTVTWTVSGAGCSGAACGS